MSNVLLYGLILFDSIHGKEYIGGPAVNIALHMACKEEHPVLISAVGSDPLGDKAKKILFDNRINMDLIVTDSHDTGKVSVFVDGRGNPNFNIQKNVAYDYIRLGTNQWHELSKKCFDLLYFGTVVQRSKTSSATLRKMIRDIPFTYRFCDINLRCGHYTKSVIDFSLMNANILKLNNDEVKELSKLFYITGKENDIINWIYNHYPIEIIIITRGEKGASVCTKKDIVNIKGIPVNVMDTVGAGDAFSAGFIMEFLKSKDVYKAANKGNEMGAYVASRPGAVPEINNT